MSGDECHTARNLETSIKLPIMVFYNDSSPEVMPCIKTISLVNYDRNRSILHQRGSLSIPSSKAVSIISSSLPIDRD